MKSKFTIFRGKNKENGHLIFNFSDKSKTFIYKNVTSDNPIQD